MEVYLSLNSNVLILLVSFKLVKLVASENEHTINLLSLFLWKDYLVANEKFPTFWFMLSICLFHFSAHSKLILFGHNVMVNSCCFVKACFHYNFNEQLVFIWLESA